MATLCQNVTDRAARILQDNTNVRWTLQELIDYTGDAQYVIAILRPDASSKNVPLQLVGGTRQSIPADGIRLLRLNRNLGNNGVTPGRSIRPCQRESLDNEVPNWHTDTPSTIVEHVIFDNIDPTHFYVFPCVMGITGLAASIYVEAVYNAVPTRPTSVSSLLALQDQYLPVILDYVLHRAYQKDAAYAGNMQRASMHLQNFANALQISMKIEFGTALTPSSAPDAQAAGN